MGKRGRPPKVKEEEVQEEVKVEKPTTEPEVIVQEEVKETVEPIKEEPSDFDLTKQNPYLVAGFKASNLYDESLGNTVLKERFEEFKQKGSEIK